ncbi:MAG: hypothetical protein H0V25_01890, partial [Solirubrobacterales bacterium]|nr:hypothetical protein [Solirubrobacterales bacterium]
MTKTLADWTTERPILTARPRPDTEGQRAAYLDLLKLALCDLAGKTTISIGRLDDRGALFARELEGEQLLVRTNGMDWPLSGLTMVGLLRLDNLQSCV